MERQTLSSISNANQCERCVLKSHVIYENELCSVLVLVACLAPLAAAPDEKAPKAQYDEKGQLIWPARLHEWMFLSAGYGMNYSPGPDGHEMFTNVFVQHWAFNIGRQRPQSEHRRTRPGTDRR